MQAVIDTVCINHLLRAPKYSRKRRNKPTSTDFGTSLDKPLKIHKLSLLIDIDGGLVDEWKRTCGEECIQVLITHWNDLNGIDTIKPIPSIGYPHTRMLRQLGFNDAIDKLILRIALSVSDRNVVSDDSDFWDPAQSTQKGKQSACVAHYCSSNLGISVMLLSSLLRCF